MSQNSNKRKLDEEFEKLAKIGRGSYGTVYKVRERGTQNIRALKRVKFNNFNATSAKGARYRLPSYDEGVPSSSLREIAALRNLQHPNILKLHQIIHSGTSIYLVLEYLEQDLKQALESTPDGLGVRRSKSYLWQLLKAISYCHSRQILHRDIKLQNLLLGADGTIKLADFGLARQVTIPVGVYTKEVVTMWYRAPELLLRAEFYGPPVDCWSLGCIFYEMLTKRTLFPGDSEIDQLFKIFQVLGTPNEKQWPSITKLPHFKTEFPKWKPRNLSDMLNEDKEAADLLAKMLAYDPFKRISAQDAMRKPYFEEFAERPTLRNIQNPSLNPTFENVV